MRIGLSLKLSEPKYNVLAQNIQALFADGSQGWWYDDNDTTTLFQDSAGTTPVTAVEQFVGLQLDKSKGLVLGPELVTNGLQQRDGGVVWGVSLAAITPNTDSQDIETKAFDTEETVADTHLGTTGQRLHSVSLTLTETDAVAAGDDVTLRLARKTADGSDDMAGDAQVVRVIVEYTT